MNFQRTLAFQGDALPIPLQDPPQKGFEAVLNCVQHVRGKRIVRIPAPEEPRDILGARELVKKRLPSDLRERERIAQGILNGSLARIDTAQELPETQENPPDLRLSATAKAVYAKALKEHEDSAPRRGGAPVFEKIWA